MIRRGSALYLFSIFAEKKLANVGPNGDSMATPSIRWNNLPLYKNLPVVAARRACERGVQGVHCTRAWI